jgi:tetratricopeptide (TPR) repeat protein
LQVDKPVVISAVSGMGGIGKSELALQYAFEHLTTTYPGGICWLKAREDLGLQIVEFARIHSNLEPPTDWELVEKVRWCWQRWRDGLTLIIFDDVQGYGDIQPFLPPPKSQFRVLLTSRSKFPAPVQDCEIKVLSEARSIELLGSFSADVKSSIDADLATAQKICHWLGYLPLGLELVGRYLANDEDLSVAEVWQYLNNEKLMAQALLTAEAGMTAALGVIAAFELSWQKLTAEAQELSARLSLFALAEIPWSLVEQYLSEWEPQQLKDLRKSLLGSSLLTRTRQGMYELHQLLREFFALKLAEMPRWVEFTTEFAQVLTEIAKTITPIVTLEQQTNLIELIPHITAATAFFEHLPDNDKNWCCECLGRFYAEKSEFTNAEFWHQKSVNISEIQAGLEHPNTASSLNNLASLYQSMGKYYDAEPLYLRSLAIRTQHFGAESAATANSFDNLGGLYKAMGKYAEAELLHTLSLNIFEQTLGRGHIDTAICLKNLAEVKRVMEKYIESEQLYIESIAIRTQHFGQDNLVTVNSFACLAELYRQTGRYSEAKPLYQNTLAFRKQHLGEYHRDTAISMNDLALLYQLTGKNIESELLFKQSLAISESQLGSNHPATATSLNNLASLYYLIGRYTEAEPLYVRSLAIREVQLGANHPDTATSLNNLAGLYQSMGRCAEAEPMYVRALEILETKLGTDNSNTQTCRSNLQILRQQLESPITNG